MAQVARTPRPNPRPGRPIGVSRLLGGGPVLGASRSVVHLRLLVGLICLLCFLDFGQDRHAAQEADDP